MKREINANKEMLSNLSLNEVVRELIGLLLKKLSPCRHHFLYFHDACLNFDHTHLRIKEMRLL